jgi:signal transduction histidine kinase
MAKRAADRSAAQLAERVAYLERALAATSEVLGAINRSPMDLPRLLDTILTTAARLSGAPQGFLRFLEGDQLVVGAALGEALVEWASGARPLVVENDNLTGLAFAHGRTVRFDDPESDPRLSEGIRDSCRRFGFRAVLSAPLLKADGPVGAIVLARNEPVPFTDGEVSLVESFAHQAVIAIENARLFSELEERLDQQTATAEVLATISRAPTELEQVLQGIAEAAARLCRSDDVLVHRRDGNRLVTTAQHGTAFASSVGTLSPLDRESAVGLASVERRVVHIPDVLELGEGELPVTQSRSRERDVRALLAVPLLSHGESIGAILMRRREAGPFADQHVALLRTFADQAVVAMENARLFAELQERNEELTASARVLRAISEAPTDLPRVLQAVVAAAGGLCQGSVARIYRLEGEALVNVASTADRTSTVRPLERGWAAGRCVLERRTIHLPDVAALTDDEYPVTRALARRNDFRSLLVTPLMRQGEPIGVLSISYSALRPFEDRQIGQVESFADQAVIAMENARLFQELQSSVSRLTALFEVGQAITATLDLNEVLRRVLERAIGLSGADGGSIYEFDEATERFLPRASLGEMSAELAEALERGALGMDTQVGEAVRHGGPLQVPDLRRIDGGAIVDELVRTGYHAILVVPLLREGRPLGALVVRRREPGDFPVESERLLQTFGGQAALAVQNARLYEELAAQGRQLEEASRHKSEFLANMSHELRTPLNAIIGFSEVLLERYFGEVNEKQEEYLRDVLSSGQHLLSLINDILDLSKVEAGRMELELSTFALQPVLESGLVMVKERAQKQGVQLGLEVASDTGRIEADERKVKQVVFNLLSNAVKFTPAGGRVDVRAWRADGEIHVAVRDTGVGVAPEDQARIFEEFGQARQRGAAEGTGLGLTLTKRFVELHGGRIWVESAPGQGSTFTFALPVRR